MKDLVLLYLSASTHTHQETCLISILLLSLFLQEFRWHGARGDLASVLGHEAGGIVDVYEASA
jgi:hypothetical protein